GELPARSFRVRVINLSASREVSDDTLKALRIPALAELTTIHLWKTPVTDDGLAHLREAPSLAELHLIEIQIAGSGLEHLETLPALRFLEVDWCPKLNDASLRHIRGLKKLKHLSLCYFFDRITDAGLSHLEPLTDLEVLELMNTNVTGRPFADLKGLTKLR